MDSKCRMAENQDPSWSCHRNLMLIFACAVALNATAHELMRKIVRNNLQVFDYKVNGCVQIFYGLFLFSLWFFRRFLGSPIF